MDICYCIFVQTHQEWTLRQTRDLGWWWCVNGVMMIISWWSYSLSSVGGYWEAGRLCMCGERGYVGNLFTFPSIFPLTLNALTNGLNKKSWYRLNSVCVHAHRCVHMHMYLRHTVLPATWQAPVRVWHCRNAPCLRESYSAPNQCSCLQTKMLFQQHLQQELSLSLQRIGLCPDMLWFFERTHTQFLPLHLGKE